MNYEQDFIINSDTLCIYYSTMTIDLLHDAPSEHHLHKHKINRNRLMLLVRIRTTNSLLLSTSILYCYRSHYMLQQYTILLENGWIFILMPLFVQFKCKRLSF